METEPEDGISDDRLHPNEQQRRDVKHNCNRGIRCVAVGRIKRVSSLTTLKLATRFPRNTNRPWTDRSDLFDSRLVAPFAESRRVCDWYGLLSELKNVIIGNEFKDYADRTKARYSNRRRRDKLLSLNRNEFFTRFLFAEPTEQIEQMKKDRVYCFVNWFRSISKRNASPLTIIIQMVFKVDWYRFDNANSQRMRDSSVEMEITADCPTK